jgi:hypothetical protein
MDQGQFLGGLTLTGMDRLVGWRYKATRRGLTRTPIDQTCLFPDLSAVRDALRWGFASPMPVTREGPDLAWSRDCPVHAFGPGEAVHARSELEAGNGCHRRNRACIVRRRGYAQRSACRGGRGRTGSVDSDARCNPVDSIGSSRESRVSHSEPSPSARFPRDKDGSARRNIEPLQ